MQFGRGLEQLEQRAMLDAGGLLWGVDSRLTIGFVPDGTQVSTMHSELQTTFQQLGPDEVWQEAILRGFQTWARSANIDIGLVQDDGSELGAPGATTGDSRFGDIRVAAIPMESDIYATSIPTDEFVDGTWVGDLLFNSNAKIDDIDQLFAVALHEAGHVLGLDHTDDPHSPMHIHGIPKSSSPTPDDIAALQGIFGARHADADEDQRAPLLELDADDAWMPALVFGDIDSSEDVDEFLVELDEGPLTVRLITDGISQLRSQLSVSTVDGLLIGEASYADATDLGQTVFLPQADGAQLLIRITPEGPQPYDAGGYTIVAVPQEPSKILPDTPADPRGSSIGLLGRRIETVARSRIRSLSPEDIQSFFRTKRDQHDDIEDDDDVLVDAEDGENDDLGAESELKVDSTISTRRYRTTGAISNANDVDRYRIEVPHDLAADSVMFVSLVSLSPDRFRGDVVVQDELGNQVETTKVINNEYANISQIVMLNAGEIFTFQVSSHRQSRTPVGNYEFVVQFGRQPATTNLLANETIDSSSDLQYDLNVFRTQLFRFGLAVDGETSSGRTLTASIMDAGGFVVGDIVSTAGELSTRTVLLEPGEYVISVRSDDTGAAAFELFGQSVDEPLGPELVDPTEDPFCGFQWLDQFLTCLRVLGDVDGDGLVTFQDFLQLARNFGRESVTRSEGDLNDDQTVTFADFLILAQNFGKQNFERV